MDDKAPANNYIDRKEVKCSSIQLEFLRSKFKALYFKNLNGADLYLFPTFVLQFTENGEVKLIDRKELIFTFKTQEYIEPDMSIPFLKNLKFATKTL